MLLSPHSWVSHSQGGLQAREPLTDPGTLLHTQECSLRAVDSWQVFEDDFQQLHFVFKSFQGHIY